MPELRHSGGAVTAADLRAALSGACACSRYPGSVHIRPGGERERGDVVIERETVHARDYYTDWVVRCVRCDQRYEVVEDITYLQPQFNWRALSPRTP